MSIVDGLQFGTKKLYLDDSLGKRLRLRWMISLMLCVLSMPMISYAGVNPKPYKKGKETKKGEASIEKQPSTNRPMKMGKFVNRFIQKRIYKMNQPKEKVGKTRQQSKAGGIFMMLLGIACIVFGFFLLTVPGVGDFIGSLIISLGVVFGLLGIWIFL